MPDDNEEEVQKQNEVRDELNRETGLHFYHASECEMVENEKGELVMREIRKIF